MRTAWVFAVVATRATTAVTADHYRSRRARSPSVSVRFVQGLLKSRWVFAECT